MINVAMKIGMRDGKARFTFLDIARHTLTHSTWKSLYRLNNVLQGTFGCHQNWKLNFKSNFMKRFNITLLSKSNQTSGKQHGYFVRFISDAISNKICDINSRLKKHLGINLTIRNTDSRSEMKDKWILITSLFVGVKNVKMNFGSDVYKTNSGETNKTFDYRFLPPSSWLYHLNHNGEIEYNILEGIVFPVGSFITVNHASTYWIADTMPTNPTNNILPIVTNTFLNTEHIDMGAFEIVQADNDQKTRIHKLTKYDTKKEKDKEAEIFDKQQRIWRMMAHNFEKKVPFNIYRFLGTDYFTLSYIDSLLKCMF